MAVVTADKVNPRDNLRRICCWRPTGIKMKMKTKKRTKSTGKYCNVVNADAGDVLVHRKRCRCRRCSRCRGMLLYLYKPRPRRITSPLASGWCQVIRARLHGQKIGRLRSRDNKKKSVRVTFDVDKLKNKHKPNSQRR